MTSERRTGRTTRKIIECLTYVASQRSDAVFYVHHGNFIPSVIRTFMTLAPTIQALNVPLSVGPGDTLKVGESIIYFRSLSYLEAGYPGSIRHTPFFVDHHAREVALQMRCEKQEEVEKAKKILHKLERDLEAFQSKISFLFREGSQDLLSKDKAEC